jgi:hypothetical protein
MDYASLIMEDHALIPNAMPVTRASRIHALTAEMITYAFHLRELASIHVIQVTGAMTAPAFPTMAEMGMHAMGTEIAPMDLYAMMAHAFPASGAPITIS